MPEKADQRPVVAIHNSVDDAEAAVIVALLGDHGIQAFTSSQLSHSVLPVSAGRLGEVKVYVDEAEAERAIQIIGEAGRAG